MRLTLVTGWLCCMLLHTTLSSAAPPFTTLSDRLRGDPDLTVRAQAALALGKTRDPRALKPLILALDDHAPAVRAAAAVGLRGLGDPRGVPALRLHSADGAENVREEIKSAISVLSARAPRPQSLMRVVVQLAKVHNSTRVKSESVEQDVLNSARKRLSEVPYVVVESRVGSSPADGPSSTAAPAKASRSRSGEAAKVSEDKLAENNAECVVLIVPSIQKLAAEREPDGIRYSATIEFLVHSMPDEAISARLSGSASATASFAETKDRARIAELRRQVIEAAIQSALSRAPGALLAASRF
ncbi:MAG TPA: HEAT repeat domain-containing protein [Polyangiaceae bacterium]|nr:HEAT repeat domain-containing protein [Polyangiaceae bacterium]